MLRRYAHSQRMIQQCDVTSGMEIDMFDFNYVPSSTLLDPPVNPFPSMTGCNFCRTTFTQSQPTVLLPNLSPNSPDLGGGPIDSPFLTEVTTSLPYHISSICLPIDLYGCMIDNERIIGISVWFLFWILVFLLNVRLCPAIIAADGFMVSLPFEFWELY